MKLGDPARGTRRLGNACHHFGNANWDVRGPVLLLVNRCTFISPQVNVDFCDTHCDCGSDPPMASVLPLMSRFAPPTHNL